MLAAIGFLTPGAIAVGTMLTAMSAGAADVLTAGRPQPFRLGSIVVATWMAGLLWSFPIVWMWSNAPVLGGVEVAGASLGLIVAVAPVAGVAVQTLRLKQTPPTITAAVCLGAAMAVAGVLAALWMR